MNTLKPPSVVPPRFLLAALFATGLGLGGPAAAGSDNPVVEIAGTGYQVEQSLADNLKALEGKPVTLHLSSGTQIGGRIKAVGEHLLHLEKVSQREFMDALIPIDDIAAVESRFRAYRNELQRLGLEEKAQAGQP